LNDRDRGKAAQNNIVFPAQRIYPEDIVLAKLLRGLVHIFHLSIKNICAKNVDHTEKIGCKIAERLQLFAHVVKAIKEPGFIYTYTCWGWVRFAS